MPSSIIVVVAFDMIGGFGTVIFAVVVTAGCAVVVVDIALGFAVVVALVVVVAAFCVVRIAVVVSLCCSVIGAAVVVVIALTGSYRADTGLLSVGCVVSRLVLSVADVGAVCVVVTSLVVVVSADVCVVFRLVVVVLLSDVVTLSDGFSLSVIVIAEDEIAVVTTSAPGSVFAQPDSRAASMSIAIAFFISVTPVQYIKHQLCTVSEALCVAPLVADAVLFAVDVGQPIEVFSLLLCQPCDKFIIQFHPLG